MNKGRKGLLIIGIGVLWLVVGIVILASTKVQGRISPGIGVLIIIFTGIGTAVIASIGWSMVEDHRDKLTTKEEKEEYLKIKIPGR